MTPAELIAAFETLADAPDGVARLRELILQLAVRGSLVAQDSKEDPAQVLLKHIAAERGRQVMAGRLRKQKSLPLFSEGELPFAIPSSWAWARLGDVFMKITDGTHRSPPNSDTGAFKYVTAKNIKHYGVELRGITYVTAQVHEEIFSRCNPERGDILYVKDGATTGVVAVNDLDEPFSLLSSVGLLKPSALTNAHYACYAMRSPFFYDQMRNQMAGVAITRVTLDKLNNALLPVPPLAEQRRIVARIDELMGLVDRLDAARTKREATRAAARDSVLAALREADSPEAVDAAWTRFAQRMDDLVCDPADIAPLRQAVLALAVRGRLVRQHPRDDPATNLVGRVARTGAVAHAGSPTASLAPFVIPSTWAWSTLDGVSDPERRVSYGVLVPGADVDGGVPLVRVAELAPRNPPLQLGKSIAPELAQQYERVRLRGDELLVAVVGSIGKVGVARPEWKGSVVARAVARFGVTDSVSRDFILIVLMSPAAKKYFTDATRTLAQPTLNVGQLKNLPVPVPPLAEQRRIVARVEELMSLLDRLEQRLVATNATHAAFADAAVHHVVA